MEKMRLSDWGLLKVLKRDGAWFKWGEPENVAKALVFMLDRFCFELTLEPMVTCATQGVHATNSQHYPLGMEPGHAVDVMFPRFSLSQIPDIFLSALKYPFGGLGLYSEWKLSPEGKPIGGMHFDCRIGDKKAVWIRTAQGDLGLTLANLRDNFR